MKIAFIVTLNKATIQENEAQIEAVKDILDLHERFIDGNDGEGNILPNAFLEKYYTFKGLDLPHEVNVFQIVPYQLNNNSNPYKAVLSTNFYSLYSRNVQYGKKDEDKVGDHPRFFNWGLKRSTDYGAEVTIHLEDISKFDSKELPFYLNSLIDPEDKHEFVEDQAVKITTLKLLKEVGQLDETKTKSQAIKELKDRNIKKGNKNV